MPWRVGRWVVRCRFGCCIAELRSLNVVGNPFTEKPGFRMQVCDRRFPWELPIGLQTEIVMAYVVMARGSYRSAFKPK